jgi:hypothetical protein
MWDTAGGLRGIILLQLFRDRLRATSSIPLALSIMLSIERQVTVPHDTLYGVLGLATARTRTGINVNYLQPYWMVYCELFKLLLMTEGPPGRRVLTLMSYDTENNNRPSWVPDFSSQQSVIRLVRALVSPKGEFRTLEEVVLSDDDKILTLRGVALDVIDQVHTMQEGTEAWLEHMFDIAQQVLREKEIRIGENSYFEGLPKKLIDASKKAHINELFMGNFWAEANIDLRASEIESHWDTLANHHSAEKVPNDCFGNRLSTTSSERGGISLKVLTWRIMQHTYSLCRSRNVIISRAGLSGMAMPNAQPGDEIVCLDGFHTPFILRPTKDHYRMVGWAYLPGLMDWSVVTKCVEEGSLDERNFKIH